MFSVCFLLFYVLTTTSASVGAGEGLPCGHCVKEWNECLKAKCSGEELKYSTHFTPGTCGWYCTSVKRRCFDDCNDASKDKLPKSTRNIIVKPAKVPYIDIEDEGELLVHVSPSVWNKGPFLVVIHRGNKSEVIHKFDHNDLRKAESSHVDRQMRMWYPIKTPLKVHNSGVNRLSVVLYYKDGPVEGETRHFTFIKAPPTGSRVVHVDHRLDAVVDINGLPMVISGLYTYGINIRHEELVPDIAAPHGFNTLLPYLDPSVVNITEILAYMDRCYQIGISYILEVGQYCQKLRSEDIDWAAVEKLVLATKDHPALLGYYLADEPGGQGIPENILREGYEFIKGIDPYHPVFMVFCCINPAMYELDFDIGMVDPYPIPNGGPTAISDMLDSVAAVGRPFALVSQAFGGGENWERAPTPGEVRVMTYLALVKGATGILYWIYGPRYIPYSTTLWSECRTLALETLDISASILGGKPPLQVSVKDPGIYAVGFQNRLGVYDLIVMNSQLNPTLYVADIQMNISYDAEVRFEIRQKKIERGIVQDFIGSYSTAVLRFPPPPSSPSPGNVVVNPSFEEVSSAATPDGAYLSVEQDLAASYVADPRISYDGLYSVRLVNPEPNSGYGAGVFPIDTNPGMYELSAFVYSHTPGKTVQFIVNGPLHPQGSVVYTVKTADTWEKFSVSVNCTQKDRGQFLGYQLVTNGTVWIDLLQFFPSKSG